MSNLRNLTTAIFLLIGIISTSALGYKTEKLRHAASILGIAGVAESMQASQTQVVKANDGQLVSIRTDASRSVEHIGIPLFRDEMRALMPSPVYDFMEYAVLNWKYKINPNTLYLSKVLFRKGSWETLAKGNLNQYDCNISNQDNRLYIVSWQSEKKDVATIGIPIEYELLANDTRRNMERDFIQHLSEHNMSDKTQRRIVTEEELNIYGTEGLFVIEGESYLMPELNQNIYFILKSVYEVSEIIVNNKKETVKVEEVVPQVVVSNDYPNESFSNLMMAYPYSLSQTSLILDFHLSDYHRQQLSVSAHQLHNFCSQQGSKVYFACSGIKDDMINGVLLVNNTAKGYNHLFTLRMPVEQLTASQPVIHGDAYLYIPPIDKTKLFGKTPTRKSGAKIYQ